MTSDDISGSSTAGRVRDGALRGMKYLQVFQRDTKYNLIRFTLLKKDIVNPRVFALVNYDSINNSI